jgi:hypothetical protein
MNEKFKELLQKLHKKYSWFTLETPRHSITNTEMFYIFLHIEKIKPTLLYESGIYQGRSTVILSEIMQPYGKIIAANFLYPEEKNIKLYPFTKDYNNLRIINGRGEDVVEQLPQGEKIAAVIDGPKPFGESWGRPGWNTLMEKLMTFNPKIIFQHDISDAMPKKIFEDLCEKYINYKYYYIKEDFLASNKFYSNKIHKPNLGIIKKNSGSISFV